MKNAIAADQAPNATSNVAVSQVDWPVEAGMRRPLASGLALIAESGPTRQPVAGPSEPPRVSLRRSLFRQ
jgi:hypothetical protein